MTQINFLSHDLLSPDHLTFDFPFLKKKSRPSFHRMIELTGMGPHSSQMIIKKIPLYFCQAKSDFPHTLHYFHSV